jgi:hypothetical protein
MIAISVLKKKDWIAPTLTEFLKIVGEMRDGRGTIDSERKIKRAPCTASAAKL